MTMNIMAKSLNMVCTTDFGECTQCTPSRLVEHGTQHDTIGSILSTSVSTRLVNGTLHEPIGDLFIIFIVLALARLLGKLCKENPLF